MLSRKVVLSCATISTTFIMWKLWNKRAVTSSIRLNQSLQSRLSKSNKHLMLHFDINKTIVMSDAVQNKALKGVINDVLAECSWGTICDANQCPADYHFDPSFVINGSVWMPSTPYSITPIRPHGEELISFMEWIKSMHPYPENGKTDQIIKERRRSYTLRFADLFCGEINEMSRPYLETYDAMESKLSDDGKGNEVFIIPAFWQCIHALVAAKRSFSILFRTFGTDIDDVVAAFNAFCREYGYDHLVIDDAHIGCVHRNVAGGHTLILGLRGRNPMDRTKEIKQKSKEEFLTIDRMKWYYDQQKENDSIYIESAAEKIYGKMKEESMVGKSMILSDDYVWWSIHGEQSEGGKFMLMDSADSNIHQIFFDDNLEFDKSGIVDVRDLQMKKGNVCISDTKWNEMKGKHLLKVEPLDVILNDNYFVEHILKFEEAM